MFKEFLNRLSSRSSNRGGSDASDNVPIKGHIEITVLGPDGKIKSRFEKHNTILNVGKAAMASRCNGSGGLAAFNYLALGSDSTAAAAAQSLLLAELTIGGAGRAQASVSRVTTSVENDTAQLYYAYSLSASVQIQEIAAFNLSGANLGQGLGRQVVSPAINGQNGDTVQATYKFQF
jgi:hypothetical protein